MFTCYGNFDLYSLGLDNGHRCPPFKCGFADGWILMQVICFGISAKVWPMLASVL